MFRAGAIKLKLYIELTIDKIVEAAAEDAITITNNYRVGASRCHPLRFYYPGRVPRHASAHGYRWLSAKGGPTFSV
jgi:hypothetical protein